MRGRLIVKKIRVFQKLGETKKQESNDPNLFVFCDKSTGVTHYRSRIESRRGYPP